MHLRRCGHIGCCGTSPAQHASAHAAATGHPLIQSFEPGEIWYWGFRTSEMLAGGPELAPPASSPRGARPCRARRTGSRRTGARASTDRLVTLGRRRAGEPGPPREWPDVRHQCHRRGASMSPLRRLSARRFSAPRRGSRWKAGPVSAASGSKSPSAPAAHLATRGPLQPPHPLSVRPVVTGGPLISTGSLGPRSARSTEAWRSRALQQLAYMAAGAASKSRRSISAPVGIGIG